MQTYSSKHTALNQLPKVAKVIEPHIDTATVVLDYGCGYSDKFRTFVEALGGTYYGFDKYWGTDVANAEALGCTPTIIACANVLNVIKEDDIIEGIIQELAGYRVPTYVQVYEGNRTGVGAVTSRGYQRNARASDYQALLERHFGTVTRKGNIFLCV